MPRPSLSGTVPASASAAFVAALVAPVSLAPPAWAQEAHHVMTIDGAPVAWREAGDPARPAALVLRGASVSPARVAAAVDVLPRLLDALGVAPGSVRVVALPDLSDPPDEDAPGAAAFVVPGAAPALPAAAP